MVMQQSELELKMNFYWSIR